MIREVVSVNPADFRVLATRLRSFNDGGANAGRLNLRYKIFPLQDDLLQRVFYHKTTKLRIIIT